MARAATFCSEPSGALSRRAISGRLGFSPSSKRIADVDKVEPRGCPTPGACSCPLIVAADDKEAAVNLGHALGLSAEQFTDVADVIVQAFARHRLDSIARLSPAPEGVDAREMLASACEPWADYHGDLPDYDHPLRPVYESGIQYAVELLAKELRVEDWTPCDGTEEFDGDLGGTLMNIVLEAMPKDEHGDPIYPRELPALLSRPPAEQVLQKRPFAFFQWNEGWHVWEQVVEEAQNEPGVVAAYLRAALTPPPKGQNDHG
jgi:hypothetical protein